MTEPEIPMEQRTDWLLSLAHAKANLPDDTEGFRFFYGLRHGTMKAGIYAPQSVDIQTPHKQDELYIVISGSGDFVKNDVRCRFRAYDVLFVEAGVSHRFENFTHDFATWVIFWGPEGGESPS
jgi:mannose-6-phosphate isomerase-like protein (cupin superfamily)